ncbi:hypothetical protein ACFL2B_02415 [Patescibacteria group bacterium]
MNGSTWREEADTQSLLPILVLVWQVTWQTETGMCEMQKNHLAISEVIL